ncbi:hypothetical protein CF327_g7180 [Tilletia walkeri]|uniref:Uncharacterized protein n=1 Tax=Tilletia walkeri TaxID=117179 RepID=A0A8X7N2G2_9BASI|nr:hypothetical protein CF327_g7180 [Tilletia walkeri]KAE8263794.1 hypothetical protein A4X09_0g7141 [Tilletia walkeri]
MWSPLISKHTLGSTLTLIVGLLALGAQASFIPSTQRSDSIALLSRYGTGGAQRPGQSCTFNDDASMDDCAITQCDPGTNCYPDGTCGHRCFFVSLGNSGCIADDECGLGGCVNGECAMVPTGGSCHLNKNCASAICSEAGVCIDPAPKSQKINQICAGPTVCLSNDCSDQYEPRNICRGGGTICENISRCGPYGIGQQCASTAECAEGVCSASGTCQYLPVGAVCDPGQNQQCNTRRCKSPDGINSYCVAKGGGESCNVDADCSTGSCAFVTMRGYFCKQNNFGETCRDLRDCLSNNCASSTNTCLAPVGATCSNNAMCASGLCEGGKCSKLGFQDTCTSAVECMSSTCNVGATSCGPEGCFTTQGCSASSTGAACVDDGDCGSGSWCSGSIVGSKSGKCAVGTRPASTTTSKATSTTSKASTATTSIKTTSKATSSSATTSKSSTSVKSTSTSVKSTSTSTKSATSTTSKPTTTTKATTTSKTTTKASSTTALPSAAACTANAVCKSGYCRKALLSDGVTRASTGTCDAKKASGARCYQNGGCISGTCDKTKGVCL